MTPIHIIPFARQAVGAALVLITAVSALGQDTLTIKTPVATPTSVKPGATEPVATTRPTILIPAPGPRSDVGGSGAGRTIPVVPGPKPIPAAGTGTPSPGTGVTQIVVSPLSGRLGNSPNVTPGPTTAAPNRNLRILDLRPSVDGRPAALVPSRSGSPAAPAVGPSSKAAVIEQRFPVAPADAPVGSDMPLSVSVAELPIEVGVPQVEAGAELAITPVAVQRTATVNPVHVPVAPDAAVGLSPTPDRPDHQLTFTAKDATHMYFVTPAEGRATEQGRVEAAMSPLSAYVDRLNARRLAAQAVQDCPVPQRAGAVNAPAEAARPAARKGQLRQVWDRDAVCTGGRPRWELVPDTTGNDDSGAKLDATPDPTASQDARVRRVDYWQRSLEQATTQLQKAVSDLANAERSASDARGTLERTKSEVGRLTELVNYWDPKKADWLIEGESNFVDRLDGPGNTKQPGGTLRKAKLASRRKTKAETERDLSQARRDRDAAEAGVRAHEAREGVLRARRDDATRATRWAETQLESAKTGDLSSGAVPLGPVLVVGQ